MVARRRYFSLFFWQQCTVRNLYSCWSWQYHGSDEKQVQGATGSSCKLRRALLPRPCGGHLAAFLVPPCGPASCSWWSASASS